MFAKELDVFSVWLSQISSFLVKNGREKERKCDRHFQPSGNLGGYAMLRLGFCKLVSVATRVTLAGPSEVSLAVLFRVVQTKEVRLTKEAGH
jgi:hypothetical protein